MPHRDVIRNRTKPSECLAGNISFFLVDQATAFRISLNRTCPSSSPTSPPQSRLPLSLTQTTGRPQPFRPPSPAVRSAHCSHKGFEMSGCPCLGPASHSWVSPPRPHRYLKQEWLAGLQDLNHCFPLSPIGSLRPHHTPAHVCLQKVPGVFSAWNAAPEAPALLQATGSCVPRHCSLRLPSGRLPSSSKKGLAPLL